jgi:D-amino-acid oxidase
MPLFLAWLEDRLLAGGGQLEIRRLESLEPALQEASLVVNCTGLGARELVDDPLVTPIRGQVVRLENPGVDRFTLDAGDHADEVTYVIPRRRELILGGTAAAGEWATDADPAVGRAILGRCLGVEPELRDARVLGHTVGLRPGRPTVRLEVEPRRDGARVIHNYGHGGSGVTVCWGCADDVLSLAQHPGGPAASSPDARGSSS